MPERDAPANPILSGFTELHEVLNMIEDRAHIYLQPIENVPTPGAAALAPASRSVIEEELQTVLKHARNLLNRF